MSTVYRRIYRVRVVKAFARRTMRLGNLKKNDYRDKVHR